MPGKKILDAPHDIVLGISYLKNFRIYIAYGEKILYLTAAGAQ